MQGPTINPTVLHGATGVQYCPTPSPMALRSPPQHSHAVAASSSGWSVTALPSDAVECHLCRPSTWLYRSQQIIDDHLAQHGITCDWLNPAYPVDTTRRCVWPGCQAVLLAADTLVRSHIARHHFGLEKYVVPVDEINARLDEEADKGTTGGKASTSRHRSKKN